jgi:serine/threonine-protein kinase
VIGLEELYLANLIVRRGLAAPEDVRTALEAVDRAPARGDFYGQLAGRVPALGQPDLREKAMASVQRYMFSKREGAFAQRARATGAVPPALLDAVMAEQKNEGLAWTLADRLVKTSRLSPVRCALLQKEAAAELQKQEQELVRRHRSTRFQETVNPVTTVSGKQTAAYGNLESSNELIVFGATPGAAPPEDDVSEKTIKLAPGVASGRVALEEAPAENLNDRTVRLPGGAQGAAAGAAGRPAGAPAPPPAPGPLALGSVLAGKYDVISELGRGGMGVVYRARSREKGIDVALKAVPAAKGAGPAGDMLARFKREILTATLVTSENVCEVYDAGQAEGLVYMAMELIEGEELRALILREAPLPAERALALIEPILQGVAACHSVHVIHRDLKPENVRVNRSGVPKIVDFGIARLIAQDSKISEQVFVTMKGTLSGTPSYVAPELVMEPDLVDERADLYSIGVIFYELLTGKLPYVAKATVRETLRDALEGRPIPLEQAAPQNKVPEPVVRFLFKLLEKDQLVRFQTAAEALKAVAEVRGPAKPAPSAEPAKKKGCLGWLLRRG